MFDQWLYERFSRNGGSGARGLRRTLRCKDVTESKRRVIVGPFGDHGIEIANVSDLWKSPGIATCVLVTPVVRRK